MRLDPITNVIPMNWLYEQRENTYVPGAMVAGPWARGTQNGAMIAGLLGQVLEETPTGVPMIPMNVHIEILKPIPLQEFTIERRVVREGRKLQIVQATVSIGGMELALGTLVRLRGAEMSIPTKTTELRRLTPRDDLPPLAGKGPYFEFVECHAFGNDYDTLGPGAAWFRVRGQIINGRPCSPLGAAILCADAGSGLAALAPRSEWVYPNVSLALHSHRAPRGEWLLLESETTSDGNGVAQVNSTFSDVDGLFGYVHQAILLQPRQETFSR